MTPKIQTTEFVDIIDIAPGHWSDWFYSDISNSAPFSWGDNDRTLVTAARLLKHIEDTLRDNDNFETLVHGDEELEQLKLVLQQLGEKNIYINLEC